MKFGLRKPGCTHTLSQKKIERKQNLKIRAGQKIFFQDKEAFSKLSVSARYSIKSANHQSCPLTTHYRRTSGEIRIRFEET
jgi:hypothetical protein